MDTTNNKPTAIKVWRVGVQDKKDWKRWEFSGTYRTFEECLNASASWIQANPGRVIKFFQQTVFM